MNFFGGRKQLQHKKGGWGASNPARVNSEEGGDKTWREEQRGEYK